MAAIVGDELDFGGIDRGGNVGPKMGRLELGFVDGVSIGLVDGKKLGRFVGELVGETFGYFVGCCDGPLLGLDVERAAVG